MGGEEERKEADFFFFSSPKRSRSLMMGCGVEPERLSLLSDQTSDCSHSVSPPTPGAEFKNSAPPPRKLVPIDFHCASSARVVFLR